MKFEDKFTEALKEVVRELYFPRIREMLKPENREKWDALPEDFKFNFVTMCLERGLLHVSGTD